MLKELLKGKKETEFSAYDIESKAHYRWSRKQYLEAAVLFEAAARVAILESKNKKKFLGLFQSNKNDYLNCISRAAICYSEAGEFKLSKPLLIISINSDWIKAGLKMDMHMIETCYIELIHINIIEQPDQFCKLYEQARNHCKKLGWIFPLIHPNQERLLELTYKLNQKEIVFEIITCIKSRKPVSRNIKTRIKLIEKEYAEKR